MLQPRIRFCVILLLFAQFKFLFAQNQKSRITVTPHLGVGYAIPGTYTKNYGNYNITNKFSAVNATTVYDQNGSENFLLKTNNEFGIRVGYRLINGLEITGGINRINLLHNISTDYSFNFKKIVAKDFFDSFKYHNLSGGLRFSASRYFIAAELNFMPNILSSAEKDSQNSAFGNVDFIENGNGVDFNLLNTNKIKTNFSLTIGRNVFNDSDKLKYFLKLNYSPQVLYTSQTRLLVNNKVDTEYNIDFTSNSIFIGLEREISFKVPTKQPKVKTPKPPKEPKPVKEKKIKEKPAPKVPEPPKEKAKVEVGNKELKEGENLVLNSIQFDQTKSELKSGSIAELETVYEMMKKYPNSKIQIIGHTSIEGDRKDNINLSEDRAKACKKYLVNRGIKSSRIMAIGKGPDQPVSSTEQSLNRRVEMKLVTIN